MYVFVYGTLKRGEPNHNWLADNGPAGTAAFYSKGQMSTPYPLVIASRYNIPFLLDEPQHGKNVEGEVFEIDEKMLAHLDILEEYPKLYTRREEEIQIIDENNQKSSKTCQAWVYFLKDSRPDLTKLTHLSEYSSKGNHNLPYIERYLRDANYYHHAEVKLTVEH